ncbi:MAG TPA: tetratricopeptide repeat protein [Gaiellaceae bacterium]|nr:tetratricopeptide repeat protein [Gaiellaceae bacterium]HVC86981.1 tetratricopeptide repeat protein [Gaiellaceae bacterium]
MLRRPSDHIDDPAALGARLREGRKAAGLTQRDLSFPGCTAAYISRIEAGARVPSLQILRKFAKRLGVSTDYLATGQDAEHDPLFEAEVALRLGDEERAGALYGEVCRTAESPTVVARAKVGLGQLALRHGDAVEARGLLESALADGHLPAADAAVAGNALGRIYAAQGRFEEAFQIFGRFLEDARERHDQFDVVRFSLLLANAYIDSSNYARAHEVLGGVLDQARQIADPMFRASLYWSQSRLQLAQGRTDLAAQYAQTTLEVLRASEHTVEAARALVLLAQIENERGNPGVALELIEDGEPALATVGNAGDVGMLTIERARALDALGEPEQAASLLLGAVSRLGDASPTSAARAYAGAADFFRARGDKAKALELYELASDRLVAPDRHLADVLTAMADIHEEEGRPDQALQLLKRAMRTRSGIQSS